MFSEEILHLLDVNIGTHYESVLLLRPCVIKPWSEQCLMHLVIVEN